MQFQGPTVRSAIKKAVASYGKPSVKPFGKPSSSTLNRPASLEGGYQGVQRDVCGRPVQTPSEQRRGAREDFRRNLNTMRSANWVDSDKYFHCVANCQATQRGSHGEREAQLLSNWREFRQNITPGEANDAAADQRANRDGREGARRNPCGSCNDICADHRPRSLPSMYWAE